MLLKALTPPFNVECEVMRVRTTPALRPATEKSFNVRELSHKKANKLKTHLRLQNYSSEQIFRNVILSYKSHTIRFSGTRVRDNLVISNCKHSKRWKLQEFVRKMTNSLNLPSTSFQYSLDSLKTTRKHFTSSPSKNHNFEFD